MPDLTADGEVSPRLGWAALRNVGADRRSRVHDSLAELASLVAADVARGTQVALGFEAPCWIPVRDQPKDMLLARSVADRTADGGTSSWSGRFAVWGLVRLLPEAAWLVRAIGTDGVTTRYSSWGTSKPLLLFEASVMGTAHSAGPNEHFEDALTAARCFAAYLSDNSRTRETVHLEPSRPEDGTVFSLLAAAGMAAGNQALQDELNHAPLLVRPDARETR